MAYDGGYQTQQHPYPGPQYPRSGPPGPARGPAQYPPQQQQPQYDDYQGDPGYDYYEDGSGYGPGYGEQYQDPGYARGPPPDQRYPPQRQDYRGPLQPNGPGRGGPRPMGPPMGGGPPGPGGPLQRAQTMDPGRNGPYPPRGGQPPGPGRGYPNGAPPGRGGGPPGGYGRGTPPNMGGQGRPPMNGGPMRSSSEGQFPGNGPQPYPPQDHMRGGYNDEAQLSNQMAGMDISQRPGMPPSRHSGGSQRSGMQPPDMHNGYEAGPGGEFGPPPRSMTTPANNPNMGQRQPMLLPPRMDSMQSGPGPNRGPPGPPRPSTGQGHRPPPQRFYPDSQGPPQPQGGYAGPQYGNGPQGPPQSMRQQSRGSYDDIFDSYGGSARFSNPDHNAVPNFDNIPQQVPRGSVDLHLNSGPSLANSGNRTKSQPDLRSQNQIFEMAGDAPPMPSLPPGGQFGGGRGAPGQPMPMRGPGAPGLPGHPGPRGPTGPMAPKPLAPQASNNPDALPSHPTPVRPGLMADSVVNVSSNSMPARAYGNQTPTPMMQGGVGPRPNSAPSRPPQEPVTAQELDRLRAIFKADANDHETGLKLAKMLVEASDVLTPNIPDPRAKSRAREKYLADAHKVLKKLSHGSNKDAMFFFADCIGRGLFSSEPDHKEAFTLYQSAAKLGHAAAAYRTAVCCEIGHEDGGGTRKDPLKAIQWYKRSATLGDTPAMYKMGMIQLKGLLGQPRNPREAIGWLKRAADQSDAENPHALHELGLLYESAGGDDVIIRDEKYAFSLFKKAAELGYKFSQFRMGCAYEYGLMGCPIDPRLSIMWYSKAAVQQEHQAELALSGWYLTGSEGVLAQSDSEAYLWARKAATAGLAKAEYAMGYFTEVGIGTAANMDDAKRWYWRAAAQDLLKARERLEDLKRTGKSGPRQRERISRSKQQEGECSVM